MVVMSLSIICYMPSGLPRTVHIYGPSRSRPVRSLLFFELPLFHPKLSHFSLPDHAPKLTKLGIYLTPAEKFHNLLSSSISTTRWSYSQGKCVLAYNSHILCCTFKNLIFTHSLNCPESCDIGQAHLNVANPLFRTPPRQFHPFARNFAHSICGLS